MKSKNELIAEQVIVNGIIVDIGHAQNPNTQLKGKEVHGVDIVEVPVPANYTQSHKIDLNVDVLPFQDASVDVVTMGCTLAHVAAPLRVVGEIHRILKPDGLLILSTPNPNYYWENVLNIFYDYFKNRVVAAKHEEHFFDFSRYNIRTIADRMGFSLVKEIGCTFALVKTPIKFNPRFPGLAYEIIYVLKKTGPIKHYATFESKGIHRVETCLTRNDCS